MSDPHQSATPAQGATPPAGEPEEATARRPRTRRPVERRAAERASKSGTRAATKSAAKGARRRASGDVGAPEPRFFNRDESWIAFNRRVLEEAEDAENPLLERVKFLAITANNLDEFFEIRIASLLQRIEEGQQETLFPDEGGMTLQQRLDRLAELMHAFVDAQYACLNSRLLPALEAEKIRILCWDELSEPAREHALAFYESEVDPLLTPVTIDPSHPFPRVLNKALCLALLLRHKRAGKAGRALPAPPAVLGVVTVPRTLPRLVSLPGGGDGQWNFLPLHELIESQVERMFRGYEVLARSPFRVTRNSNLYLQEEEARSVLESVRTELHNRRKGDAVRLEIERAASPEIVERLRVNFELEPWQVFHTEGPVNLSRLVQLVGEVKRPELKYPAFHGRRVHLSPKSANLFDELRTRDILVHHPFDSYSTVENFIEAAAKDPAVLSMKQTLYRTSEDSPLFTALTEAAQTKDVTVVVELMARFDEASNIRWAREMEDAGVGVFHGIVGLKTHCKLALLVRRDADGVVRRYAHLGTGNYNSVTARFYTDISLLTARPEITAAVQAVFRYLTAESEAEAYAPLLVAPLTLAPGVLHLIAREAEHARAGRPAGIVAKMNGLIDGATVEALYAASQAGVEIDLVVRGMCSLRPGVPGLSERIRVRSVVGRYLEHSRITCFENGGAPEVFCGSADWMPRNLYERCEVVFPVLDPALAGRLRKEILGAYLADTVKTRMLEPDGSYRRVPRTGAPAFNAQEYLMTISQAPEGSAPAEAGVSDLSGRGKAG
ncbi:MAG: polyphosphate kinase 1 [Acidobacteriota bacterium]|nr:polyphosphate kinase 1 [Acidobacteriota bacterium]